MLPRPTVQTFMFLKLLVAGHMTIYLTRNSGWFWERPWPDWRLLVAAESTQALGTLAAVYGWFMPPIGWHFALLIWAYALGEFAIVNVAKVWTYRAMSSGSVRHARHLKRVHATLRSCECPPATCRSAIPRPTK